MITISLHFVANRMQRVCYARGCAMPEGVLCQRVGYARGCAMPEGVTTVTHIMTLNSSGFQGILNGKYDLVIIMFMVEKNCISLFIDHYLVS